MECVAGDRIIALFHRLPDFSDDKQPFYALDGICPHQGGPLGKGKLEGDIVTCPWHGWQFSVSTGRHGAARSICHGTFPVKVQDGDIWVEIPSSENYDEGASG